MRLPVDIRLRRILLADPDEAARTSLMRMLARLQLGDVRETTTSTETYDILQRAEVPIDLLITELTLPPHDGFALIRSIRGNPNLACTAIPIVAMTAAADGGVLSRLQKLDVPSLLVKPVRSAALFSRITLALRSTPQKRPVPRDT
ncbi:response regulator [Ferrovibrio sp.]|uniref:response regulator n=1 Tax=Ferrovibrio sp. TaxID=1917215 RepID=UPI00311F583D